MRSLNGNITTAIVLIVCATGRGCSTQRRLDWSDRYPLIVAATIKLCTTTILLLQIADIVDTDDGTGRILDRVVTCDVRLA